MNEFVAVAVIVGTLLLVTAGAGMALTVALVVRLARYGQARVTAGTERLRLTTRARSLGPQAEVARLQLELRDALASVRRVLATARDAGWPLGDAPGLVRRLERAARSVEAELGALTHERNPLRAQALLPAVRSRVATLSASAGTLRQALLESSLRLGGGELEALHSDCALEAQALRARLTPPGGGTK